MSDGKKSKFKKQKILKQKTKSNGSKKVKKAKAKACYLKKKKISEPPARLIKKKEIPQISSIGDEKGNNYKCSKYF